MREARRQIIGGTMAGRAATNAAGGGAEPWDLPAIASVGALADWLRINPGELEWFADLKGRGYKNNCPPLRHYHYQVLAKRSGDVRLIEVPKQRLKELQRQMLARILDPIPPHPAVHGFRKGRSIKTFISPHVGQRVVVRMDLRDFFPSLPPRGFKPFFARLGTPNPWPICSEASVRMPRRATCGINLRSTSIR
jgi:RNA-directed DNA polymerase